MPAAENQTAKQMFEFGPFRVDPEKQLLLRDRKPVALTPKSFQLLLVLVQHSNQVVTKDELMKALWPDTFVEETNLTRNIFSLRKALGETELNRYIVTVPGQGYRLAATAQVVSDTETIVVAAERAKVQVRVENIHISKWVATSAVVLLAVIASLAWRFFAPHSAVLGKKDTVVLADFDNSTGDPVFDGTLRQGMAVELEQSPFLSLVSDEHIRHALSLTGGNPDARLTSEIARQICERLGSTAVIGGGIAPIGSEYVVSLHTFNCNTGDRLDDQQVQVARKEDVLNALTQMAHTFRSRVGESIATIQQHATPLPEATTPSLEALKAYSAAWKIAFSRPQDAIVLLRRSVEIDPNFAMAWAFQGRLYADIWEPVLSNQSTTKAYELRSRTSDRERYFIETNYESLVTGNLLKTRQICHSWANTYPRDAAPHAQLSWIFQQAGKYQESADEARKAINLDPDFTPGYTNLGWAYVLMDRLGEAESTLQQASDRKLEMPELLVMRYYIAFLEGDQEGMQHALTQGQGLSEAEDWLAYAEATVLVYSGHLQQARTTIKRAMELAQQANQPERAATYAAGMAVREAFFGDSADARRDALTARSLSQGRDVGWGVALALALSGDVPESQKLGSSLQKGFSEDTSVQFTYSPILHAVAALQTGDATGALEALRPAAPSELGVPGSWSGFFGNLYPIYLRGSAYLASGRPAQAAMEFQNLLNHPGIVFTDPVGIMAQLQLARAYATENQNAQARAAYEVLLAHWSNADPEIPILQQARAEYAKLKSE